MPKKIRDEGKDVEEENKRKEKRGSKNKEGRSCVVVTEKERGEEGKKGGFA